MVRPKVLLWSSGAVLVLVAIGFFAYLFVLSPSIRAVSPVGDGAVALDATIAVTFNKPVNRKLLMPSIEPEIPGQWHYEGALVGRHLVRTIRFEPHRVFDPETSYTVRLDNVRTELPGTHARDYSIQFTTEVLPTVASVAPADGTTNLSVETSPAITLTAPAAEYSRFDFTVAPEFDFTPVLNGPKTQYTLEPAAALEQGIAYQLTVTRTFVATDVTTGSVVYQTEPVTVYSGTFATATPPQVSSFGPINGGVLVSVRPTVVFSQPMDGDSLTDSFSIEPPVLGSLTLSDDGRTLTFTPDEPLPYETEYAVSVAAGAKTASGGFLTAALDYQFTTIGPVEVVSITPADTATGVATNTHVRVTFNQDVDQASAEAAFGLSPVTVGAFSWDSRTLTFTPRAVLAFGTDYRVSLASGIKSVNGLDSLSEVTSRFTTAEETIKLGVGLDYQDRPLSCEAAALKMALSFKGTFVSETDIMNRVGYDPTERENGAWGDPYQHFVGDIDGVQNTTGYGVYWGPIASAGSAWRPTEAFTNWTTAQLAAEIESGNPVVVWGTYAGAYQDSWTTPDGRLIDAWKGEHTRVAIGFVGSADNPTTIILNDPIAGQLWWSRATFETNWRSFGNAGVVVR